jgi:hypothetical protein
VSRSRIVTVVVLVVAAWVVPQAANASGISRAWVGENSQTFHGVLAHYGVPGILQHCPPDFGDDDYFRFIVEGDPNSGGEFVQIGYEAHVIQASPCYGYTGDYAFWSSDGVSNHLDQGIRTPAVAFNYDFSVNRLDNSSCVAGSNWCWQFRIGGTTYDTCCHDDSDLNTVHQGFSGIKCRRDYGTSGACPSEDQASMDLTGFQVKRATDDTWIDWSGKDGWCVDYSDGGRAHWNSDTSASTGFNVTDASSKTTCPGL